MVEKNSAAGNEKVAEVRERVNQLADDVQERFQDVSEEVRKGAERATAEIRRGYERASQAAREGYEDASRNVREGYTRVRKDAGRVSRDVDEYVRDNPAKSVLIAAGVGFLVGLLCRPGGKE